LKPPASLSQQLAEFHRGLAGHHRQTARRHRQHGHDGAALRHEQAAEAHALAAATPLDQRLAGAAMRASGIADEASQRAGVRPFMPWPGKGR